MKDLRSKIHEQENFDIKELSNINVLFQPAYTWVWNAPIERSEVISQLQSMVNAGIRTVYILPEPHNFRRYNERIGMMPDYLTDEFFEILRYAIKSALDMGMAAWLYDEGGWPSGSACGQVVSKRPELCRKSFEMRSIELKAGTKYKPGKHALAAFHSVCSKPCRIFPGDVFHQDMCISEFFVKYISGGAVDPLDIDLGKEFICSTHIRYYEHMPELFGQKDFNGDYVPGSGRLQLMFTDEPGAGRLAWPRGFEDVFYRTYGYDILDHLPALFYGDSDADAVGTRARIDYRELAGNMFRDNYFKPIHDWCRKNNTLSGGHLDIDHLSDGCMYQSYGSVLSLLREMDIPGIDVIWRQIDLPSTQNKSACAEGNGFFPRFAASAASQSGGKYVLSESFAVYGGGLTGTEMFYVINYQLARGINLFNFMVSSYGAQEAVGLVMRPDFRPEMPGYKHLCAINDYTARACYIMQLGRSGADTALYLPLRDIWSDGSARLQAVRAFDSLGHKLEDAHVDFDIIDDECIRDAVFEGGVMRIGTAVYRHIAIPKCIYMPDDIRQALACMDASISPSLSCNCSDICVRTRILPDNGMIWMLFNGSFESREFDIALPGEGNFYQISASSSTVTRIDSAHRMCMRPGEAQFLMRLPSNEHIDAVPALQYRSVACPTEFVLRKARQTQISREGLSCIAADDADHASGLGCWADEFGRDFSGEAIYTAYLDMKCIDIDAEYAIDLGRVECSAKVSVNGTDAGIAWHEPFEVRFSGSMLKAGRNRIDIEVANTLANVCSAQDLRNMFCADDLGPYQEKVSGFEVNSPIGGLYGPVTVFILERK